MNIYIAVDMEGITGICSRDFTSKGNPYYNEGRKLLMHDVNAAIEGALAGGASRILAADVHGGSYNFIFDEIHPKAEVLWGAPGKNPRFPFLDESIDAMFLLGYHAMAGTKHAVLEHTMSSKDWFAASVNGIPVGEVAIDAAIAGVSGVPVTLVSGDDKVCAEASALLPGVATATVKLGLGRHRALCYPKERTGKIIFDAAREAVGKAKTVKPFTFKSPVEVAITYKHTENADSADGVHKDGYTVVTTYEKYEDWWGGLWKK
ncbi:MAG: M55 family metallopeptidase [Spirochaetes bacterium]|nr:M55 family metallopeptidase [Spirochaetota bacterium]